MKFRGRLAKENLVFLSGIVSAFEKNGNTAAVYLTEGFVRFIVIAESIENPRCFCEIPQSSLFFDYRIESQNDNKILFEIGLNHLSLALHSGRHSLQSQLQLTKRGPNPCLCFETTASNAVGGVDVLHDIPIRVLKHTDIAFYQAPDVPPPQVSLELPREKLFRTVIERMHKMSKVVYITACADGRLTLAIDNHTVTATVKTYFTGLRVCRDEDIDQPSDASLRDMSVCCQVDVRKLHTIMQYQSGAIPWSQSTLHMSHNATMVLAVDLITDGQDAGSLIFYFPVVLLEDGEGITGVNSNMAQGTL